MNRKTAISRRSTLGHGLAASLLSSPVVRRASAATAGLRATVTIEGRSFEYAMSSGEDQGDFVSEIGMFTQQCVRATRKDFPLVVYFRPDRSSDRVEVVFELGSLWQQQEPAHLNAYSVVITRDADELAKIDVPKHFWFARWRWQSGARPVVANVDDLIARHLLPPFKTPGHAAPAQSESAAPAKGLPGTTAPATAHVGLPQSTLTDKGKALGIGSSPAPGRAGGRAQEQTERYAIMGLAGVTPQMGRTGERPDIGLVTGSQGEFITTGSAAALTVLRDQAEAAGTVPWHLRDERTGAPIDLDAYPKASWYPRNDRADPYIKLLASDVDIDSSHQPALSYLPYLLTGDPYHLEDLQFAANWNRGCLPPSYRLSVPQTRAFAWSMRSLGQCAKVTPAKTPRWLLPQAYWRADLDRMLAWVTEKFVDNRDVVCAVFRSITDMPSRREEPNAPQGSHVAPWEDEFCASSFGWLVLMGFDSWRKAFEWKIGGTFARTNGKSGWLRAHCTPYRQILKPSATAPFVGSWADSYALTAKLWQWQAPNPDDYNDEDPTYLFYTRGALVIAAKLGVTEADECLRWAESQVSRRNLTILPKWQLV